MNIYQLCSVCVWHSWISGICDCSWVQNTPGTSHVDYQSCWETKQFPGHLQSIKKLKCIFGSTAEHLQMGASMIVKVIAKKEEENIPFMKCKLPAVENYWGK